MRKIVFLIVVCFFSLSVFAQKRSYLLYTDANLTRLKDQVKNNAEVKQAWNKLMQKVDGLMQKERNAIIDVQELGLVYRMTGDEKYAKRIKETIINELKSESWEDPILLKRTPAWNSGLHTAHCTFNCSLGFDCIYDYLNKDERKAIAEGIVRLGINRTLGDWINPETNIHTIDSMGHNWWSACVDIAGFAALALRNEMPEWKDWVNTVQEASVEWFNYSGSLLDNKIPTFDREGGFWESINYANFGFSQYLLFRLAHQNVFPNQKQPEIAQMEPMADFFIKTTYFTYQEALTVNFGDGNIHGSGRACVLLLWNLGFQKERYAWFLDKTSHGDNKEWMTLESPVGLALNPNLPKYDVSKMPGIQTSSLLPDMGWAMLRNSWKDNATMLAVKSGLTWNHSHADAGSYILFHNGKNLIIDSGNCSYANPLYTEYYCQSEAHNVVLWNGKGQEKRDAYFGTVNHGSLQNLLDAGEFKYVLADATGPYSHNLLRNYRSFLWVGDVILVYDDLLAYESGQFEWLLHYNGVSKRNGLDLSIKQDNAEVIVRPLFPETFPDGGLPHDFPEKMRLDECWGWQDHKPENKVSYLSVSHFEKTERTKLVTAIILKTDENNDKLPVVERFDGKDFLGVRITQNGETTECYFNLLADGRIKHRNSLINMNGWDTDAYLLALTFKQGADYTKASNLKRMFIGQGSYLRKGGEPVIRALSKFFTAMNFDKMDMLFSGQKGVKVLMSQDKKPAIFTVNGQKESFNYDQKKRCIEFEAK
jgi:Heparinase II/III-like protein.